MLKLGVNKIFFWVLLKDALHVGTHVVELLSEVGLSSKVHLSHHDVQEVQTGLLLVKDHTRWLVVIVVVIVFITSVEVRRRRMLMLMLMGNGTTVGCLTGKRFTKRTMLMLIFGGEKHSSEGCGWMRRRVGMEMGELRNRCKEGCSRWRTRDHTLWIFGRNSRRWRWSGDGGLTGMVVASTSNINHHLRDERLVFFSLELDTLCCCCGGCC